MTTIDLTNDVRELRPAGARQPWARLLLVRCRLLDTATAEQAERHQSMVMGRLVRVLARSFGPRNIVAQLNDLDILVVLAGQGVNVATVMIREAIAEVRAVLLGAERPMEEFSVEALHVQTGAPVGTLPMLTIGPPNAANMNRSSGKAGTDTEPVLVDPLQLGPLRYSFAPIRDVRHKAITTYILNCHGLKTEISDAGVPVAGERTNYDILHGGETSALVSTIDLQLLKRATAELAAYRDQRVPFAIVWHLHARTIENPADFQRYAKHLGALAPLAEGRIVIELVGVRPDWPVSRMQAAIGMVRRYVPIVAVRTPLEPTVLPALRDCGASNVSVVFPGNRHEADLQARMIKFCDAAARVGLTAVAESVGTRSVAAMAISAGFRYVHVDYLAEQQAKAHPAARFDLVDLFALPAAG